MRTDPIESTLNGESRDLNVAADRRLLVVEEAIKGKRHEGLVDGDGKELKH